MADPVTREEMYLSAIAEGNSSVPEPITREEKFLAKIAGEDVETPEPVTRKEKYYKEIIDNGGGGGGSAVLINKDISANGTYNASSDNADGYKKVTVNVPNPSTGSISITQNGTYDVTEKASAVVDVPTLTVEPLSATENGTYQEEGKAYSPVSVNVPSSGGISVDDIAQNLAPSGSIVLSDSVTQIKDYAFAGKPITSVYGKNVTSILTNSFVGSTITGITDDDFPNLGVDSVYIVLLRLPNTCTSIKLSGKKIAIDSGSYALRDCKGLVTAEFPNAAVNVGNHKGAGSYCLAGCTNLEMADLGFVNSIGQNCFNGDTKLATIVLRNTSLVPLTNVNAFTNTPFKSGGTGGTIYIPKVLYDHLGDGTADDYQNASNWSTVYGYGTITWAKIEGSIYE